MDQQAHQKVTASHLQRLAYLYVRQSSLRQVMENTESTVRQYALRERAVALGWPVERIVVVDGDQGQSGASAADRAGFQTLVAEVGMGHVGIVLGLEVSRLARNNTDWHRLLEICALTGTLILDEDGVYDPAAFNDRLLLGLKGTMSEAELHVLRARLRGGVLNKARRGALKMPLPIGFCYREDDQVILDPDAQIQHAVRLVFETFRRTGAASATVRAFREQGLTFPQRVRGGPRRDEVLWRPLQHSTVLDLLHHPRYAGAFVFGRRRTSKTLEGRWQVTELPREQWVALFPGSHEGYITWDEYEENQARLRENARAHGVDRAQCPPREGPALLQGLALCGRCGERLGVHYHQRHGRLVPDYVCQHKTIQHGHGPCQIVPGGAVDAAIGELLVAAVTPQALEVALAVQGEVAARAAEAAQLRRQQVERARYEADVAQRRFLRVDPDNRLVADVLEAEWNARLRDLAAAQEEVERRRHADGCAPSDQERTAIQALAADFPRLWHDPRTPDRERKRMARLLIADVTIRKADAITLQVRFTGGATQTLTVPTPLPAPLLRRTDPAVVAEIDHLLDAYTDGEVAERLNAAGRHSYDGKPFHTLLVSSIRQYHHLPDRFARLRARGLLTVGEMAARLAVSVDTVERWRGQGLLRAERYNDRGERLYHLPDAPLPAKWAHKKPRATAGAHVG
ncbi:MAG: recombinase family protein [Chloroflexota bacterium]|nr:recombinase family protein [Chloroflexota bacterium]